MKSETVGLIIGSGFEQLGASVLEQRGVTTPYGAASSPLLRATIEGRTVWCIARHGLDHGVPPHVVNYRANICALKAVGVEVCVGLNWVGGIATELAPGQLAVPEQLIDYTYGRETSFWEPGRPIEHIELSSPFDRELRSQLARAVATNGLVPHAGTYGVTQGPRLETAAEIDRLERDGCTMVGMTAMPEAVLARQAGLRYAILAAVVNYAAGRSDAGLHEQMQAVGECVAGAQRGVVATWLRTDCDVEL